MDNLFEQATQITKAHAYDILREQVKELKAANKELIEVLKDLTDRAEKARGILQSDSSPSKGFWGVLDTATAKEAIQKNSK